VSETAIWARHVTTLGAGRRLSRVTRAEAPLSNEAALAALATDASFRSAMLGWLADEPFPAYFWELPPLSRERANEPFEFVVSDAPPLARVAADVSPFRQPLEAAGLDGIAEFANLGGDAWLLAPDLWAEPQHYPHLSAFVRGAPETQRQALFARVGQAALTRLSVAPLWISTSGLGVYWLHVRFDSSPKYYQYGPYKRWPCV
jgi:hypothetical protein